MAEELKPYPPVKWDEVSLLERHPELHHYTTVGGALGIIEDCCLWATHYGDLNDATELNFLRRPLQVELEGSFRSIMARRRIVSQKLDRAIGEFGGIAKAAQSSAETMVRLLYASTFDPQEGVEGVRALRSPAFVSSFCTHTNEQYEREHGLLSQWRGYGAGGGVCLVFNSADVLRLLESEHEARAYMTLSLEDVRYMHAGRSITGTFPDLIAVCEAMLTHMLIPARNAEPPRGDIFMPFLLAASVAKHPAFHEEREVRITVRLATEGWREAMREQRYALPSDKEIKSTPRGKRYIELFRDLPGSLPIQRVVVGPGLEQERSAALVKDAVPAGTPIVMSATPYIEPVAV